MNATMGNGPERNTDRTADPLGFENVHPQNLLCSRGENEGGSVTPRGGGASTQGPPAGIAQTEPEGEEGAESV